MKLTASRLGLIVLLVFGGSASVAWAQSSDPAPKEVTAAPKPGPEIAAILKLFGHGATWEGVVPAGALGPNSSATTSNGRASCGPLADGFWCRCDVEDTMGSGEQAKTWRGHMIVGYDLGTKKYRGVAVDNFGAMTIYDGRMDGATLTLETPEPVPVMGVMMKDRLTFVGGANGLMASFKDEHKIGDGEWTPFETVDHMTPLGVQPEAKKAPAAAGKGK